MIMQRKLLERLDKMLDAGIDGTFEESDYDETQLSKLEAKWSRYLSSSKLAYQKTLKEREQIQTLVSDISHQTKTPLSNILLYTELLQEQCLDDASRKLVGEIRKQSEKLEFLIQSLVKTSRLEAGTFTLSPKASDVDSLINSVISQIKLKAEQKHVSIQVLSKAAEGENRLAKFDAKWTQEALYNVLDNAVKYSPENSEVRIERKDYEMFECISVADKGVGIAEEECPLVFGRFYRGKNVREEDGVGIGLYLCRQIIEGQGGYVTVTSEIGKGSEFEIFLPK